MTDPRPNDGPRPFPAAPDSFEESSSSRFDAEVDFSSERPSSTMHGPRPSASVMKLVGGLVGGSLLLAGIVTLIRGDDDDADTQEAAVAAKSADVELVAASLAAPLEHAIIALEPARMESITASAVRGMTDKPTRRELARRAPEVASDSARAPRRRRHAGTHGRADVGPRSPAATPARCTERRRRRSVRRARAPRRCGQAERAVRRCGQAERARRRARAVRRAGRSFARAVLRSRRVASTRASPIVRDRTVGRRRQRGGFGRACAGHDPTSPKPDGLLRRRRGPRARSRRRREA
jgi:hypothetical protein